jgi:hypothetical protein
LCSRWRPGWHWHKPTQHERPRNGDLLIAVGANSPEPLKPGDLTPGG